MKKTCKLFGTQNLSFCIIVFIAVIGFTFAACSGKKDSGSSEKAGGSSSEKADTSGKSSVNVNIRDRLMYDTGHWTKDDDDSTYFTFSPTFAMSQGLFFNIKYNAICYMGAWEISGDKITGETVDGEKITFNVALNDKYDKLTVSGLTGGNASANGIYRTGY